LEVAVPLLFLGAIAMIAYGWAINLKTSMAGPLIPLFAIGYAIMAYYQIITILVVDIYSGSSATTAANNLVRCMFSAEVAAFVEGCGKMVDLYYCCWHLLGSVYAFFAGYYALWVSVEERKAAGESGRD
jgi:hypothetical protein